MPRLPALELPEHIYWVLAQQAKRERRSMAQQAVVALARGLQVEVDAKARRRAVIADLIANPLPGGDALFDPVKLIREDRRR